MGIGTNDASRRNVVWCITVGLLIVLTASEVAVRASRPANCVDYCRGEDPYDMIGCISRCINRADHQADSADGSTQEQEERGALILTASSEAVVGQTRPSTLSSSATDSSILLMKILQNQAELRHAIHQAHQEVVKLSLPNTMYAPPSAN